MGKMNKIYKKSILIRNQYIKFIEKTNYLFFFYIIGIIQMLAFQRLLPFKYYADAYTIKHFIVSTTGLIPFDSFNNIAYFYKVLGFSLVTNLLIAGIFTFTISYIFILVSLYLSKIYAKPFFLFVIFGWITIMSIYLGQFSKEISVIILSTILLFFSKYRKIYFIPIIIILISLYAYYFRIYWFIILYLIIIFYISEKLKGFSRFLFIIVGIFILYIISNYFLHSPLTNARTYVNITRIGSTDAETIILNPFPNNNWLLDFLNSLIVYSLFIIPIPIILKLKFKYILFTLWIWVNLYIFLKLVFLLKTYKFLLPVQTFRRLKFSIYIIIAFIITQSIFEPDYGSFLKHQVGLTPIYIFLLGYFCYLKQPGVKYENSSYSRSFWRRGF